MFRIREITYANNCVFHCIHKEIDNASSLGANYSFRESGLQITLRLLSSSLGNTVLLHTLFLKYETNRLKKSTAQCFSNCAVLENIHAPPPPPWKILHFRLPWNFRSRGSLNTPPPHPPGISNFSFSPKSTASANLSRKTAMSKLHIESTMLDLNLSDRI